MLLGVRKPVVYDALLDSFYRADQGPPPSSKWTAGIDVVAEVGHKVVSNQCSPNVVGSNSASRWNVGSFGPDAECFLTTVTANEIYRLWVRMANPNTANCTGYYAAFDLSGNAGSFFRVDAGPTYNNIGNFSTPLAAGYRLKLQVYGSILVVSVSTTATGAWVQVAEATDATYSAAGLIGVRSTGVFDNFGGATLL